MSSDKGKTQAVKVFISLEHVCGYYPDRIAQNLVLDPIAAEQKQLYDAAITRGFRRGGQPNSADIAQNIHQCAPQGGARCANLR